ncbi:tRNA (N6-isopentenyl adenosine(37)-C2)-methylthiotransferase MiaB [Hippea alviniae]|uniref:tRNA (N6-isopentenyl adenosine(37)-C2)-methylthiotransferase MiaB n=1 Tax=Hippea alviniae TaxID=1279027 RepID=UPI0003B702EB|nr:tRNA (N6-isopentenyl adenosine(37)-C2)-methylthiotransferase MiaB [Hippea alviniae]
MRFYIKTFGCQMNERDSEKVEAILEENGWQKSDDPKTADLLIVNSCAVREKAENKIYSEIGRLRFKNRKAKIVAMGCVAQFAYDRLSKVADIVIGTNTIDEFCRIAKDYSVEGVFIKDKMEEPDHIFPHVKSVVSFVDIMYGCDNFCTYCIVPYTRGREISRKKEAIIDEIKELVDNGTKEVVLLGQNVNSYGKSLGYNFVDLLYEVNKIEGLKRIRFTTSHPKDFSKELIYAIRDLDKLCEHVHLPFQAGSNRILKLMRRKYTIEEYLEKVFLLKSEVKNCSITTDIIVGFPTETENDFEKTLEVVKTVEYDTSFSFKYSPRRFTKAAEMEGQIEEDKKLKRLNILQQLQAEITQKKLKEYEGKIVEVLIEGKSKKGDKLYGRNRQNIVVNVDFRDNIKAGDCLRVKITKALKHSLIGEPI